MVSIILNDRSKAWRLAFWCSVASVIGGLFGYVIGAYLFDAIGHTIIDAYGLNERFASLKDDFHAYGFWLLILKGFTPIPYKLFTIASGVFHFSLWQFILASIIARAGRFFALAAGLWYLGPLAKPYFERFFKWITFAIIILVILGFVLVKFI
jgi:membrane protein YqaA with SNARE-associated domain